MAKKDKEPIIDINYLIRDTYLFFINVIIIALSMLWKISLTNSSGFEMNISLTLFVIFILISLTIMWLSFESLLFVLPNILLLNMVVTEEIKQLDVIKLYFIIVLILIIIYLLIFKTKIGRKTIKSLLKKNDTL